MPCFHPKPAIQSYGGDGKKRMKLIAWDARALATHYVDCQTCLGCRDKQAAEWTLRLKHETRLHSRNTFLTVTYDDEHLPLGLQIPDMQKFWKRLRKAIPNTIKHFYCGEYGDRTKRAHYHAAVFGLNPFGDEKKWDAENETSEQLTNIWGQGIVTISELTTPRMAYVAGYVMKKAGYKTKLYCDEDGVELQAPFRKMSQGLAKGWLEKYENDLRLGYAQTEGRKLGLPRYYTDRIKKSNPQLAEQIENAREKERAQREPPERERCKAGEIIRQQQITRARRDRI